MRTVHLTLILIGVMIPALAQQKGKEWPKPRRPPDIANGTYGAKERNVFDLWKAKSNRPTPSVIFLHGALSSTAISRRWRPT